MGNGTINFDADVLDMCEFVSPFKVVYVYAITIERLVILPYEEMETQRILSLTRSKLRICR